MANPPPITVDELLARYDGFLLDAYGVLVDPDGALPGAVAFLERLHGAGKQACVLSNDASRSVAATWQHFQGQGLRLPQDRIITSGDLLEAYFAAHRLGGKTCAVVGTDDAADYVRAAGGRLVPVGEDAEVLVVADDYGYPFLPTVNAAVSAVLRRLAAGQPTALVLPNPDLIYPRGDGYGITAGAIALMIEGILRLRDPSGAQRFAALGKPHPPIFAAGLQRLGSPDPRKVIMIGDQLVTDVRGANAAGLDCALALTGVCRESDLTGAADRPTYLLRDLS